MKQLKHAALAAVLLASLSVEAQETQEKPAKAKKPTRVQKVIPADDSFAEFKNRNNIKSVHWKKGNIMVIVKNDGTVETYDLDDPTAQKKAEELYGVLPPPPPPPPKLVKVAPPPPPKLKENQ